MLSFILKIITASACGVLVNHFSADNLPATIIYSVVGILAAFLAVADMHELEFKKFKKDLENGMG